MLPITGISNRLAFAMKRGTRPDFHTAAAMITGSISLKWLGESTNAPVAGRCSCPRMRSFAMPATAGRTSAASPR